jgi:methylated-DNA-protein-cysteine methyltransferase related protein
MIDRGSSAAIGAPFLPNRQLSRSEASMPRTDRQEHDHTYASIYGTVARIPAGHVATYGSIARRVGLRSARLVGYALSMLPAGSRVPWHRVVNRSGAISLTGGAAEHQRSLLEAEGVCFDLRGRIDLHRFGWDDDTPLR